MNSRQISTCTTNNSQIVGLVCLQPAALVYVVSVDRDQEHAKPEVENLVGKERSEPRRSICYL